MKKVCTRSKSLLLISSVLITSFAYSQIGNYVTNGGFEKHLTKNTTNTVSGYVENAVGWDEISGHSSLYVHYYNSRIPFNGIYFNYPRTDSAYAALDAYCSTCGDPNFQRIYFRNKLKQSLIPGKEYCVTFYVNVGNNSAYGLDSFGAHFGGGEIDTIVQAHAVLSYLNPQVENASMNFITDTLGWTKITGIFVATGSEKYMVVGNFKSDAATNTIVTNSTNLPVGIILGVDDVSCISLDLPAHAGNDTTCVNGGSVYLGRQRDVGIDDACKWYQLPVTITPTTPIIANSAGIWVSPSQTTTYVVRQEICNIVKFDTVIVYHDAVGMNSRSIRRQVTVYPNPAAYTLQIDGLSSLAGSMVQISLYNILGDVVLQPQIRITANPLSFNVESCPVGYYTLELKTNDGFAERVRIVLSR